MAKQKFEIPDRTSAPSSARDHTDASVGQLQGGLGDVLMLLRAHTGHDFSLYKKPALYRRIERRMGIHQIDRIASYVRFLKVNPQELELLFRELLIGVTSFFRDPAAWECLREVALTPLIEHAPAGHVLRAWVPGCSTGEEAYSLAISFKEATERYPQARRFPLQIFATDLDGDAIDRARKGRYPASIASDVSSDRLERFFVATDNGYQVGKEIRDMVVFAPQNVVQDPPFTKLDLLLCRNLLIYFGAELKAKLLPLFHNSLAHGGVLFLGIAEAIGGAARDLFAPLYARARIYRRIDMSSRTVNFGFPERLRSLPGPHVETRVGPPQGRCQVELERELREARDEILSLRKSVQTTQEELKSANEALITSSKEMQSLNAALQTVEVKLQCTSNDLSYANHAIHNLLAITLIDMSVAKQLEAGLRAIEDNGDADRYESIGAVERRT